MCSESQKEISPGEIVSLHYLTRIALLKSDELVTSYREMLCYSPPLNVPYNSLPSNSLRPTIPEPASMLLLLTGVLALPAMFGKPKPPA